MATDKIFYVTEQDIAIAGPFDTWAEAKAWTVEFSSGDRIEGREDPTAVEQFHSNPEPQEMTAGWARDFARAA